MKVLLYVECGKIGDIDDSLGASVDGGLIEKYAVLTVNGVPVIYEKNQDSAHEYLTEIALNCKGLT